jgi:nucleoside-diphosphate-sugar epimerase
VKIGITGLSSEIGSEIAESFRNNNHEVVGLTRSLNPGNFRYFDLEDRHSIYDFGDLDVLVHCAWNFSDTNEDDSNSNIQGSIRLFNSVSPDCKIYFISTISAYSSISKYGQMKLYLEKTVSGRNGINIRCGILWGKSKQGFLATLIKISRIPIICPHLSPDPPIFQTEISEVVQFIQADLDSNRESYNFYNIVGEKQISLSEILHNISQNKHLHIRLSQKAVSFTLKTLQVFKLFKYIRADSLNGTLNGLESQIIENAFKSGTLTKNSEKFCTFLSGIEGK